MKAYGKRHIEQSVSESGFWLPGLQDSLLGKWVGKALSVMGNVIGLIVETSGRILMSPGMDDRQKCGQRVDCSVFSTSSLTVADLQLSGARQLNECARLVQVVDMKGRAGTSSRQVQLRI